MDPRLKKTAVFGIGGAGCKIIRRIAPSIGQDTVLVGLDRDQKQLDHLGEDVQKIAIDKSLSGKCDNFEGLRRSLTTQIGEIESALEDVGMAIIIVGLGGKTGTCISNFIADFCENKSIFSLFVVIYPFSKVNISEEIAKKILGEFRDKSGGVIVIDNNLKQGGGTIPMLQVFEAINSMITSLIQSLIRSNTNVGVQSLDRDELRMFFYGKRFYFVTSGEGANISRAVNYAASEIDKYEGMGDIDKMLVILKTPFEAGIEEIKGVGKTMQDRFSPESIKWINLTIPRQISEALIIGAVKEVPIVHRRQTVVAEEKDDFDLDGLETIHAQEPKKTEKCDPEEASDLDFFSKSFEIKSPALIGLNYTKPGAEEHEGENNQKTEDRPGSKDAADTDEGEYEIDELVGELTGFPVFKKKGQKKLKDYDDWGIDYI